MYMNNKAIKRWFALFLLMLVAGVNSAFAQKLTMADFTIKAGETQEVTIALESDVAIYGFQTDLTFSEGLSMEGNATALQGQYVAQNVVKTGATRVATLSLSGNAIVAGDVIKLTIKADDTFTGGTITLGNTRLTLSTAGEEQTVDEIVTVNVTEGEDITSEYIINAPFNPTADPFGWTATVSDTYNDYGMFQIGGKLAVREEFAFPTADATHLDTEYAAGLECRWSNNFASYTQTTAELPAGGYMLSYDVENVNASTTSASYENRFTVTVGETVYTDESTEWMEGGSAWTTHTIKFVLTEATAVTISLGYGTGSNNIGAANTPALYVSHLNLSTFDPLADAKAELQKEIATAQAMLEQGLTEGVDDFQAAITAAETTLAEATTQAELATATETLKAAETAFRLANMFTYQKYIITNIATGKYWGAGNDWGTRASLVAHPEYVKLVPQDDGTYFMESQVNNGGTQYYFNGDYMDNGSPVALTITKVSDGQYTIANGTNYYGYDGSSTVQNLAADSENALWTIVSLDDAKAALADATADEPKDATLLIEDHDFGRNNRYVSSWSMEASNKNLSGGNNTNNCAESYHSVFTLSQVLEGAPAGIYALTAQGFYRQDGDDNDNLPVFFANDETQTFPLKTGNENSMSDASVSFSAGSYTIDPIYIQVEEGGTLTIGAKLENNTNLWCIWDNFVLTYYGADATMDQVKNAAILAELQELREKAESLKGQAEVATIDPALETALTETADVSGTEAINAAIETLKAAIGLAEASIKAKDVLPKMKELTESTNFYTEAAYEEYYGQWIAKYEDGTLTSDEANALQDPFVVTGWHASITCDNFLLSAWDTNPDFVDAPYYINTWSIEGESDGSEFKVPFFEYWTGDANSLGEKTLTGTMTNLPAGKYNVTAQVRVRMKNDGTAPAYGITMQANDGETVDVAAGTQIGESQFYMDNFTATGEVGEDGTLAIKFIVAEDNNISWLSFKNVKYEVAPLELAEGQVYVWDAGQEAGGSAVATDGVSVSYANAGNTTIRLNGKADYSTDYVTITLDQPLKAGDQINVTAYRNKNDVNKKSGAKVSFEIDGETVATTTTGDGLEFVNIDQSDASADDSNRGTEPNTITIEVPADAEGCTVLKFTRSQTQTNLFITKIEIVKSTEPEPQEKPYEFVATEWIAGDAGRISADKVVADADANTITVSQTGQNNVALIFRSENTYTVTAEQRYFVIKATGLSTDTGASYLWWLNNTNNSSQIEPTDIYEEDGQTVFAWDCATIAIGGQLGVQDTQLTDEGGWSTTFGMTLADEAVPAVISYIGFQETVQNPVEEYEYEFVASEWPAGDPGRITADKVVVDEENNTITVSQTGTNNVALNFKTDKVYYITEPVKYFVIQATGLSTEEGASYLWWLNAKNNGNQVAPTKIGQDNLGIPTFVWDVTTDDTFASGFNAEGKSYLDGTGSSTWSWTTTFGLTLADETVPAVFYYIGFEPADSKLVESLTVGISSVRTASNGEAVYNLNGQRVNASTKGILVRGGKKFFNK